jgi:hypothetical protein
VSSYLGRAQDPNFNGVLSYFVRPALESIEKSYKCRGRAWPPADLKYLLERICQLASKEDISSVSQPKNMSLSAKSAFQLFNKLRANDHRRVVQIIRSNKFDAHPFEEFLKNRRASLEDAVRDALSIVEDYDACLNILERVLEDDETKSAIYVLTHNISVDEEDLFATFGDKREKDLKSLGYAVATYYCNRTAKREIDISQASRGR